MWTIYNDSGKASELEFSEQEARNTLLEMNEDDTLYAMNSVGDYIMTFDGPIHVALKADMEQTRVVLGKIQSEPQTLQIN